MVCTVFPTSFIKCHLTSLHSLHLIVSSSFPSYLTSSTLTLPGSHTLLRTFQAPLPPGGGGLGGLHTDWGLPSCLLLDRSPLTRYIQSPTMQKPSHLAPGLFTPLRSHRHPPRGLGTSPKDPSLTALPFASLSLPQVFPHRSALMLCVLSAYRASLLLTRALHEGRDSAHHTFLSTQKGNWHPTCVQASQPAFDHYIWALWHWTHVSQQRTNPIHN